MKKRTGRRSQLHLSHLTVAVFLMTGAAQATDVGARFIHVATDMNTAGSHTRIDHPLSNNDQSAIIHVTQNWNPPGTSGTYNAHAVGVSYDPFGNIWEIINKEGGAMSPGASFNIWIPVVDAATFVHTSTTGSITDNHTVIDHSLTNNNPDAIVRVTQNVNPGGNFGVTNNHEIGVWYNGFAWAIFNQDSVPMPEGASFNVTVVDPPFFADGFESGDTSAWSAAVP